ALHMRKNMYSNCLLWSLLIFLNLIRSVSWSRAPVVWPLPIDKTEAIIWVQDSCSPTSRIALPVERSWRRKRPNWKQL
ncbi:hypothetical protein MVLG_07323, partial [Microbotryum lychnidis-dioicae p1A1 Lamole]